MKMLRTPSARRARRERWGLRGAAFLSILPLIASDHADPIDPFNKERLEGGITDLFVFPIGAGGEVASLFKREDSVSIATPNVAPRPAVTAEQEAEIAGLAVVLCVRRALTEKKTLMLEPYTYRIHMDLGRAIEFTSGSEAAAVPAGGAGGAGYSPPAGAGEGEGISIEQARARYGGKILEPERIRTDVSIAISLDDQAGLKDVRIEGLLDAQDLSKNERDPQRISIWSGVRDDPFIFPAFFGTNVVAIVLNIPIRCFPEGQKDWLIWATSHRDGRQVDHVGRSLRTQNPRFELLNTLPPSEHVAAIKDEHEHPSLLRDLALRFNMQSLFAYRKWDFVPDVMVYTRRFPVGFPNGRALTDDVAALLAQHGDTLLLELSHQIGAWPRRTTNDMTFSPRFPYLAEPWPDKPGKPPAALSSASWMKLIAIAVSLLLLLVLENWIVARWYHKKQLRKRYV